MFKCLLFFASSVLFLFYSLPAYAALDYGKQTLIGADFSNIDLKGATQQGVIVMNTPDGNAVTTAEHTVSMMMAASRLIPQATASMKAGSFPLPTP